MQTSGAPFLFKDDSPEKKNNEKNLFAWSLSF